MERRESSSLLDQFKLLSSTGALEDLAALRRENRELDALVNDAAGLFALEDLGSMVDFAISRILERFIPERLVFLVEEPRGGGYSLYSYRNLKPDAESFPVESYGPIKRHFLSSPFPIAFADLERRLGPDSFGPEFRAYDPRILFPMRGIRGLFGMALLGRKIVGGDYSELERMYVDRFTRFLSIGIQNSLHHTSSITDAKTGLYNHDHFLRRLGEELARDARRRWRAGVLMLDIDHFKKFNDSWGHLAGDELLAAIASTVKNAVRSEDVVARFGGEEFCVLAVDCDEPGLMATAERVRAAVAGTRIIHDRHELGVTASIGCCLLDPAKGSTPAEFIERADKALYLSKAGGRDISTLYRYGLLDRAAAIRNRLGPQGPEARAALPGPGGQP